MYFDYAAATPVDKKVLTAMQPYFSDNYFNPSAAYSVARQVRAEYEDAKHRIAQIIGARPAEIVITAGATESINLALNGATIVTTAVEHPAVLECVKKVRPQLGSDLQTVILPVDETGRINLDELRDAITDETTLISVGYANNEIGTIQPIREIANIVSKIRQDRLAGNNEKPLYFHTDASQAVGLLDINVARLGVDLMTLNAGKCYGPKQVGLLYVRAGVELTPLIFGGGQELGLRSGTENVAGVIGFAKALEIAEKKRKSETKRQEALRSELERVILDLIQDPINNKSHGSQIKSGMTTRINGSKKHHLPNILNFSVPGLDAERAVFALDQLGVYVATGSACAANKGAGSHVLRAIGLTDDFANGSIRISMGRNTTSEQIKKLGPILREVIEKELRLS